MDLFAAQEYREVLQQRIDAPDAARGFRARMAAAAGCHPSYLSQVLHSHVTLTPDQALGIARFLGFSVLETDYFLLLVDLSRARTAALKERLRARLAALRTQSENLSVRLGKSERVAEVDQAAYYSSWEWAAVHIATSIRGLRRPEAIATRLRLPVARVRELLHGLERMGLVKKVGSEWRIGRAHLHSPRDSQWTNVHHSSWRMRAISRLQGGEGENGVHYSVLYALSAADAAKLRGKLVGLLEEFRSVCEESPEEELVVFGCDLFPL